MKGFLIFTGMSEAGLPAAKDQRSTVKTIMRLCHPDKCRSALHSLRLFSSALPLFPIRGKHPEAKRAMQILGPLLS